MDTALKVVIATRNPHKAEEITHILAQSSLKFQTLADYPGVPEVTEDGLTVEENALKKARSAAKFTATAALADDTGLEVDALDGAPGVFCARYAGDNCSYSDNNRKLLAELSGVAPAQRSARFRCVIALVWPDGKSLVAHGLLEGYIISQPRGENGFGYDSVFEVQGSGKTLAELTSGEKNAISHRSRALRAMLRLLSSGNNNL